MSWWRFNREVVCWLLAGISCICNAQGEDSEFVIGVASHFAQTKGDLIQDYKQIKEIGFNSFRDDFYWQSIERTKGSFQLPTSLREYSDALMTSSAQGVKPLLVLAYGNSAYTPRGMPILQSEINGFTAYAQYVIDKYKGQVFGYQIWNEWNKAAGSVAGQGVKDVESYWKLVEPVAKTIRRRDPSAKILVGAVAGRDSDWLSALVRQPSFSVLADGITVHPYNYCDGSRSYPEDVVSWLSTLEEKLQAASKYNVPIYLTEIGWPTNRGKCGTDADIVGDYFVRLLLSIRRVETVRGVYFYDLRDDGHREENVEHNFGLFTYSGVPKPAVAKIKNLLALTKDKKFISAGPYGDVWVSTYSGPNSNASHFIWTRSGAERKVRLRMSCGAMPSSPVLSDIGGHISALSLSRTGTKCIYEMVARRTPIVVHTIDNSDFQLLGY